jgi:hypothetical protein
MAKSRGMDVILRREEDACTAVSDSTNAIDRGLEVSPSR